MAKPSRVQRKGKYHSGVRLEALVPQTGNEGRCGNTLSYSNLPHADPKVARPFFAIECEGSFVSMDVGFFYFKNALAPRDPTHRLS